MKKRVLGAGLAVLMVFVAGVALAAEDSSSFLIGDAERLLYGEVRTGSLIDRISGVERDLFGRDLPGSVADRQVALVNFIEKGAIQQPSMLFKLGVAEWVLNQRIDPFIPVVKRLEALEVHIDGTPQVDRPVAMRLERVLGLLVGDGVLMEVAELPEGTVVKASLYETLSPKNAKEGDVVPMILDSAVTVGTSLVAPRGSRVEALVTKVTQPGSFGRPGQVQFTVNRILPLGPEDIPLTVGERSESVMKAESAQLAAAGTSVVGALLLGPLGLAGGFLVRGDVKEIPVGSVTFAETAQATTVSAYPVPEPLQGLLAKEKPVTLPAEPEKKEPVKQDAEPVHRGEGY